jgi:tetratricopeptide (TPR) repeat protein
MECRRSLVVALGVALGSTGCVWTQTRPTPASPDVPPQNIMQKDADGPKRPPKASTLVALAEHREAQVAKDVSQADQNKYRDQARKHYLEALQVDANYLPAYLGLARVYRDLGDYTRALETYRKALEKHPREVTLWIDLGMCQARKKDFDQAIQSLGKAVELDPENRHAMQTLGFCLARAGRTDESVTYLMKTMDAGSAHLQVARMVQHLHQSGHLPLETARNVSRRHLQLALAANPTLAAARQMLSQLDTAPSRPELPQADLPRAELPIPQLSLTFSDGQ